MGSSFYSDSGLTSTEQDSIESAIAAAETAQSAAETAKADAETAKTNAETAEVNAETAQTAAEAAQTAAETAQVNAGNSASASATSATQSASSATSSASSASTASTKASEASVSATNALASANNASSSASSSATSATESATSATASASSATSAAASLSTFQNQYLGASASAPTQDPDGSALDLGDLYFDTSANVMKVYSSSGWTNASSSVNGTSERQTYTATAGQTTFSVTYDAGYVDVWLNGAKLLAGTDFTATSGTNIELTSAAAAGDIVDIIAFGTFVFTSNDHYTKTQSDARYEPIDTAYTKAESDARYVELSGDTITGDLTVNGNLNVAGTTVTIDSANAQTVDLGDNDKIRLGDGDDLQIYHDGSHSYIKDSGTGDLLVLANKFIVKSASGASSFIQADPSATDVKLFFGNVEKLATTSSGVDVTGTVTADGLTVDGDIGVNRTATAQSGFTIIDVGGASVSGLLDLRQNDVRQTRIYNSSSDTIIRNDGGDIYLQPDEVTAIRIQDGGDISFYEDTGTTAKLFWDASAEALGIGTSSPSFPLSVQADSNAQGLLILGRSSDDISEIAFRENDNSTALGELQYRQDHAILRHKVGDLRFATGGTTERMRIDSSGNLLVGTTSTTLTGNAGFTYQGGITTTSNNGSASAIMNRNTSDGDIVLFRKDNTTVGSISASTNLNIGSGSTRIWFRDANNALRPVSSEIGNGSDGVIDIGESSGGRFKDLYLSGKAVADRYEFAQNSSATGMDTGIYRATSSTLAVKTNSTERMRVDSSGNLLVGTTDTNPTTGTSEGIVLGAGGIVLASNSGDAAIALNRTSSNGVISIFKKDGTEVGNVRSRSNVVSSFIFDPRASGIGISGSQASILPVDNDGNLVDNSKDLGRSDYRWDDIFATNGTIQTSDENEKQQIASLTDAEIIAAKAISKLFKTFKWNDKVEAKGDAARTHTGVIAQQVETAMSNAGLDAGKYAFFISTTWWEANGETYNTLEDAPEGATERNRKGIRYPELLSFIGAATEQRLANLETRVEALEAN